MLGPIDRSILESIQADAWRQMMVGPAGFALTCRVLCGPRMLKLADQYRAAQASAFRAFEGETVWPTARTSPAGAA